MLVFLFAQVSEKLRERAARNEADEDDFIALAEQVEEFTLRFLDPLKHFGFSSLGSFCGNPELDIIFETATKLGQKKVTTVLFIEPRGFKVFVGIVFFLYQFHFLQFFDHPVVGIILSQRWYTRLGFFWKIDRPGFWLFLNIWCLVDVLLFPLSFSMALILGNANSILLKFRICLFPILCA